jgi:hypothetical protein
MSIDGLAFDANINKSLIKESDIVTLLPTLDLPNYYDLTFSNLDVKYIGTVKKFNVQLKSNMNSGYLDLNTNLDFTKQDLVYGLQFKTENLDLSPFINTATGFI